MRNTKRFLAVAMTAVMTVGSSTAALAANEGVTGNGIVEYDNSEDIAYDIAAVDVPTLTASKYNFTLDPTGQLHTYNPSNYDEGTVYFSSTDTRASIKAKENVSLFTQSKKAVEPTSGVWNGIVKTVAEKAITEVESGFFVWVPDTANETYTAGKPGKFVEITKDNIGNWFELAAPDTDGDTTIKLKPDYKFGANVCDGKVYQLSYDAVSNNTITDSDTDPLSKYVTIENDAPTAFPNLYKDNSGEKVAATAADIEYTAAKTKNQGRTDAVTVINKSTKAKTVTAKVTMKNISNITFKDENAYDDDTDASMYVAATDGTTANTFALEASADGATANATYSVDLAAPTITEITYMTSETNEETGGHNYARYEAYGTVYNSDSFYITASANSSAEAKDAWDEWAKEVTDETRPEINIVYTVADKVDTTIVQMAAISVVDSVAYARLVAGVSADSAKIVSVKVDNRITTDYTVTSSGAITISGTTGTGNHAVEIVYDGATYTGSFSLE